MRFYTRKSTEEGLEQEFNSLDAQREEAEAYIKSQRQLGWTVLPQHYDDGGFTGGNIDRPAPETPPRRPCAIFLTVASLANRFESRQARPI